jgi:hypothetical protein
LVSPEFGALIERLLEKDPHKRITVKGIWEHPWMMKGEGVLDLEGIAKMKVHEVMVLDEWVLAEMRALGYEVVGLLQEIRGVMVNARTAAYKMLRRKKVMEEVGEVDDVKLAIEGLPSLIGRRRSQSDCVERSAISNSPMGRSRVRTRVRRRSQIFAKHHKK